MPINKEMNKEDVVHWYNEILLSNKKEKNNLICNNMHGPTDCHTEWNMSEKVKHHMISFICGIDKNDMNLFTKRSHRFRKQAYGYQLIWGRV